MLGIFNRVIILCHANCYCVIAICSVSFAKMVVLSECRELPRVPAEDAEPQRKSSMWTNLKSFANEILSIWKRS